MVEANYEFEHGYYSTDLETLRRQEYWTMLSGASGQLYGNKYTWQFLENWQDHLDTPGSRQMTYMAGLFARRPWFRLVPDQSHTVVTKGNGTFTRKGSVNDSDYLTAARTDDGMLVIAYLPTSRTITVNMTKLSGQVLARWFDPTSGTYTAAAGSRLPSVGRRQFTSPDKNADGDEDWVLVLTAG